MLCLALCSCGSADPSLGVAEKSERIVYGADDREEFFELEDGALRALFIESMVALVPNSFLPRARRGTLDLNAPTWAQAEGLCSGEPFGDQPAAAFCTGVLLDWDLVLTAGHCVRQLALDDFSVVFGYYYDERGRLASHDADVFRPIEVVSEALGRASDEERLDFAWLRLERGASAPRRPAAVHVGAPRLAPGDAVLTLSAGGGVPLKLDSGAHVIDARAAYFDYFVADTDTSKGSSGGAAFSTELGVAGILARGGTDYVMQADGCKTTVNQETGAHAAEQFTYVQPAVEALCASNGAGSSLCRADCDDPCRAVTPELQAGGGCSLARRDRDEPEQWLATVAWMLVAAFAVRIRWRSHA